MKRVDEIMAARIKELEQKKGSLEEQRQEYDEKLHEIDTRMLEFLQEYLTVSKRNKNNLTLLPPEVRSKESIQSLIDYYPVFLEKLDALFGLLKEGGATLPSPSESFESFLEAAERMESLQQGARNLIKSSAPRITRREKMYSVDGAAEVLGVAPKTIRRWIKEQKIEAVKVGKSWKIKSREVNKLRNLGLKRNNSGAP